MNRGSLHTRSFRFIDFSVFKYSWTKNGFTGPKSFRGFRKTGPRSDSRLQTSAGLLFANFIIFQPNETFSKKAYWPVSQPAVTQAKAYASYWEWLLVTTLQQLLLSFFLFWTLLLTTGLKHVRDCNLRSGVPYMFCRGGKVRLIQWLNYLSAAP